MRTVLVGLVMITSTAICQQGAEPSDLVKPGMPSWAQTPKDAAAEPATQDETAVRDARSHAFDDRSGLKPKVEQLGAVGHGQSTGIGMASDRGYVPPLPVNRAAAIVVGRVISSQPYLSKDHTAIYTELLVQLEQILKDKTGALSSEGRLAVLEAGGGLRANGQILRVPADANRDLVDVGNRYMLFLYQRSPSDAFGVSRAWKFTNDHPAPVGPYRTHDVQNVTTYTAMTEAEFIGRVHQAVVSDNTH